MLSMVAGGYFHWGVHSLYNVYFGPSITLHQLKISGGGYQSRTDEYAVQRRRFPTSLIPQCITIYLLLLSYVIF